MPLVQVVPTRGSCWQAHSCRLSVGKHSSIVFMIGVTVSWPEDDIPVNPCFPFCLLFLIVFFSSLPQFFIIAFHHSNWKLRYQPIPHTSEATTRWSPIVMAYFNSTVCLVTVGASYMGHFSCPLTCICLFIHPPLKSFLLFAPSRWDVALPVLSCT